MPAPNPLRSALAFLLLVCCIALLRPAPVTAGTNAAVPAEPPPPLLTGIRQVDAGGSHTCVLTEAGGVKCWGNNVMGQLGDGGDRQRPQPADVPGLTGGVTAISANGNHTCALLDTGGVKCWGDNYYGPLGDGSRNTTRRTPVDVVGLDSGVQALYAGDSSTCVLMQTGGVKCWGVIALDQVTPTDVPGLSGGITKLVVGYDQACVLTDAGGLKCWSRNLARQPDTNGAIPVFTPAADVPGLSSGVIDFDLGTTHACAVTAAGVKCWGSNIFYQLGDGTTIDRLTPVDVTGAPAGIKAISAGNSHTCVITQEDTVLCWGWSESGRLGNGSTMQVLTPVKVQGLSGPARAVAAGGWHSCALSAAGTVQCWGNNSANQLGRSDILDLPTPTTIEALGRETVALLLGGWHTCAWMADGEWQCWGYNNEGELGGGDFGSRWKPRPVQGIGGDIKMISTSPGHSCVVTAMGGVKCWGYNAFGELGNGGWENSSVPVDVVGLSKGVAAVAVGFYHSCALLETGAVKCWGDGERLGEGGGPNSPVPVPVAGLESGVTAIVAGEKHTCVMLNDSQVKCWRWQMTDITGFDAPIRSLHAGGFFTCALLVTDGVQCWGDNLMGELGVGEEVMFSDTPLYVAGLHSGVQALTTGGSHACVLTAEGAQCWGLNQSGRIGDGTLETTGRPVIRYTPVKVVNLGNDILAIAAGGTHTCAILGDHSVKCWGSNSDGQLAINPGWSALDVYDARPLFLPFAAQ